MERVILHVDMNSYFATVEQQARPELRGRPIAVWQGRSGRRRLAIAASVEAKAKGVRTAMRYDEAMERCPELIWVPADHHKYQEVTRRLLCILERYSPELEIFSVDEAFLDLTRTPSRADPVAAARAIKEEVRSELGEWIRCSVGIAPNKFMAKLASDLFKPDALVRIKPGEERWLLQHAALADFCGIGARIEHRLRLLGIRTVDELAGASELRLRKHFGIVGQHLIWHARGLDYSPLEIYSQRKDPQSMGHETTLPENVLDRTELREVLLRLSEMVGRRLRLGGFRGRTVYLRVRYADFSGTGRRYRFEGPVDSTEQIMAAVLELFRSLPYQPIRLLGVTASELSRTEHSPQSLFPEERARERLALAVDQVNDRFGEFTLSRGYVKKGQERQLIAKHFGNKRIEF